MNFFQGKGVVKPRVRSLQSQPPEEELVALGRPRPQIKKNISSKRTTEVLETTEASNNDEPPAKKLRTEQQLRIAEPGLETVNLILQLDDQNDVEQLVQVIVHTLTLLRDNPMNPEPACYLSLIYVAKLRPHVFAREMIWKQLLKFLKNEKGFTFKKSTLVPILVCNLLYRAFAKQDNWPIEFVQEYLEDSFGERLWVDDKYARSFVDNIITAFPSKTRTSAETKETEGILSSSEEEEPSAHKSTLLPLESTAVHVEETPSEQSESERKGKLALVRNRFPQDDVREKVYNYVYDILNFHLTNKTASEQNIIKVFHATCAYSRVRNLAAYQLEGWLNNVSTVRYARELFFTLVDHCTENSFDDIDTLQTLLKMKLKNPNLVQMFLERLQKLLSNNPAYPLIALRSFLINEMAIPNNKYNPKVLLTILQSLPPDSVDIELASIIRDTAANKNFCPVLKLLLRTIAKILNNSIVHFDKVALALMKDDLVIPENEDIDKYQWVTALVDLIPFCIALSMPPAMYDTNVAINRETAEYFALVNSFRNNVAHIQNVAVRWCYTVARILGEELNALTFNKILRKLLLLEPLSAYISSGDNVPEQEKAISILLQIGIPVLEGTLFNLVQFPFTNLPISNDDVLEIVEHLIYRAINLLKTGYAAPILIFSSSNFYENFFRLSLCNFTYSDPVTKEVTLFANKNSFWQICYLMVICGALNARTLGRALWEDVPTVRCLMEMVIARSWKFPPFPNEQLMTQEEQILQEESKKILAMEKLLLSQESNSGNTSLLDQLMKYDLRSPPRRPPYGVIEQLKQINKEYRLGHILCSSRDPDFLVSIMKREGASNAVEWLGPIVSSEEHTLNVLPIECLCYLLLTTQAQNETILSKAPVEQTPRILSLLRKELDSPSSATEILKFFLTKLAAKESEQRLMAKKSLALLLTPSIQNTQNLFSFVTSSLEPNPLLSNNNRDASSSKGGEQMIVDQNEAEFEEEIVVESSGIAEAIPETSVVTLPHYSLGLNKENNAVTSYHFNASLSTSEWLSYLNRFPFFQSIRKIVVNALIAAIQTETDVDTLCSYLDYLRNYSEKSELQNIATTLGKLFSEQPFSLSSLFGNANFCRLAIQIIKDALDVPREQNSKDEDFVYLHYPNMEKPFPIGKDILNGIIEILKNVSPENNEVCSLIHRLFPSINQKLVLPDISVDGIKKTRFFEYVSAQSLVTSAFPQVALLAVNEVSMLNLLPLLANMSLLQEVATVALQRLDDASSQLQQQQQEMMTFLEKKHISIPVLINAIKAYQSGTNSTVGAAFLQILLRIGGSPEKRTTGTHDFAVPTKKDVSPRSSFSVFDRILSDLEGITMLKRVETLLIATLNGKKAEFEVLLLELTKEMMSPSTSQTWSYLSATIEVFHQWFTGKESQYYISLSQQNNVELNSVALLSILVTGVQKTQNSNLRTKLCAIIECLVQRISEDTIFQRTLHQLRAQLNSLQMETNPQSEFDLDKFLSMNLPEGTDLASTILNELERQQTISPNNFNYEKFPDLILRLVIRRSRKVEAVLSKILTSLEKSEQFTSEVSRRVTDCLVSALMKLMNQWNDSQDCSYQTFYYGLIIDWIVHFNGDMDNSSIRELIFFKKHGQSASTASFELSLLITLIHQSSWISKRRTMSWFFGLPHALEKLNPRHVLDFIAAYLFHPHSWVGFTEDDVLHNYKLRSKIAPTLWEFDTTSITFLADLIIEEENQREKEQTQNTLKIELTNPIENKYAFENRVSMLLACANQQHNLLEHLLSYLHSKFLSSTTASQQIGRLEKESIAKLLEQIYISDPQLVFRLLRDSSLFSSIGVSRKQRDTCELDVVLHTVMRKLEDSGCRKMAYIFCQKLAIQHPDIFIDFLPTFGALLKGRSHLSLEEFIKQQHHVFFTYVLGVLNTLRPAVFQSSALKSILQTYFDFLATIQSPKKEISSFVGNLVDFLCHWVLYVNNNSNSANTDALNLLLQHKSLLLNIAGFFPKKQKKFDLLFAILDQKLQQAEVSPSPLSDEDLQKVRSLLRSAVNDPGKVDALKSVFAELDKATLRVPSLLGTIYEDVLPYLAHKDYLLRQVTFQLALRYADYTPATATRVVNAYLLCLDSDNEDIKRQALQFAADFFPFADDKEVFLLQLFKLGRMAATELKKILHDIVNFLT